MKRFLASSVRWLVLAVILSSVGFAQITPSADSYTNTASPTTNYGAKTLLDVDGASQITYIQFPLTSIPSGANVSQATLKLYVNSVTTAGSFNVDYVVSPWAESTIDASNAPPPGGVIASNVNVTTADKNQYILVDVTSAVQAWLSGTEDNTGLALVANSNFDATFDSKENTATSHPAELDVVFAAGTVTNVGSGTGLTGGPITSSGTLSVAGSYQLPQECSASQLPQWNGSAWACTSAGVGTVTSLTAGTGLTASPNPITGSGTLSINTAVVPQLTANNTFTGNQFVQGNLEVLNNSNYEPLAVQSSNTFGTWLQLSNTSAGGTTWNILSAGSGNSEGAGNLGITNLLGGTIWLEGPVNVSGNQTVSGNVGVNTASPRTELELDANAASTLAPTITLTNNGGSAQVSLDFNTYKPSTTGTYNPASRILVSDAGTFTDNIYFQSNFAGAPNGGLQTNMGIYSNGDVGIGGQTPGATLDVMGSLTNNSIPVLRLYTPMNGNLIVGQQDFEGPSNVFRVDASGKVFADGGYAGSGADFAESMAVSGARTQYEPGDVLAVDTQSVRRLTLATGAYSTRVAGVYSTKPGMLATPHHIDDLAIDEEVPLAVVGIVPCKASAENGGIVPGDLLVTSHSPGRVMKGTNQKRMLGAVIGKALEPLPEGTGTILVLVTLQ